MGMRAAVAKVAVMMVVAVVVVADRRELLAGKRGLVETAVIAKDGAHAATEAASA